MGDVPEKELDQRFREAEQYTFDFPKASQPQPPSPDTPICIYNCKEVCGYCKT